MVLVQEQRNLIQQGLGGHGIDTGGENPDTIIEILYNNHKTMNFEWTKRMYLWILKGFTQIH